MSELERKYEAWKSALLDTGRRNKMIDYKSSRLTTLKITEPSAEELFERLAVQGRTLRFMRRVDRDSDIRVSATISLLEQLGYPMVVEEGDIRSDTTELERNKTLKNLRAKAKLAQEEQGTHVLYLSFGFIYWREKSGGEWMKSPLLLVPVTVSQTSLRAPYTLSLYEDDIEVNPTLTYKFKTEYNIALPGFDEVGESFAGLMDRVGQLVDKNGWRLERNEVSLGLLSFLKISMYHDLEENRDRIMAHPVLQALAGDRSTLGDVPAGFADINFDDIPAEEMHEVIDADSTQQEAILLAKRGVSFVMQGPPGTGKSQTITNIIAEALADGKKVLFVSEKAAALDVVLRRLESVGLADACLSLHDYKANKKEIIQNIGKNLYLQAEPRAVSLTELTRLMEDRAFIRAYAEELHRVDEKMGISVYMAYGELMKHLSAPDIPCTIPDVENITSARHAALLSAATDLDHALAHLENGVLACPWYGAVTRVGNQAYRNELLNGTKGLGEGLRGIACLADELRDGYGFGIGRSWREIREALPAVSDAIAVGSFPACWLDAGGRTGLRMIIVRKCALQMEIRKKKSGLYERFRETVFERDSAEWLARARRLEEEVAAAGFDAGASPLGFTMKNEAVCGSLSEKLTDLAEQLERAAGLMGLGDGDRFRDALRTQRLLRLIRRKPTLVREAWFDAFTNADATRQCRTASALALDAARAEREIRQEWGWDATRLDPRDLRRHVLEAYPEGEAEIPALAAASAEKAGQLCASLEETEKAFREAEELLALTDECTLENARRIGRILNDLSPLMEMEGAWLDIRRNRNLLSLLDECARRAQKIRDTQRGLEESWTEGVSGLDTEEIAMRFRMLYTPSFRETAESYGKDMEVLGRYIADPMLPVGADDALGLLKDLQEFSDARRRFAEVAGEAGSPVASTTDAERLVAQKEERLASALRSIDEAEETARRLAEEKREIGWTDDFEAFDAERMRERFEKDHKGLFAHLGAQYKSDKAQMRALAGLTDDREIVVFLGRLAGLRQRLRAFYARKGELEKLTSELWDAEATDWAAARRRLTEQNSRVTSAIRQAGIETERMEACRVRICGKWSAGVFHVDWMPLTVRLRTKYNREFLETLEKARQDEKTLTALFRLPKEQLTQENVERLADGMRLIRAGEKWFEENGASLREAFGIAFKGTRTDFDELNRELPAAIDIADQFPFGAIPMETVKRLCAIPRDFARAADVRRLASRLSETAIKELEEELSAFPCAKGASRLGDALPLLRDYIQEDGGRQRVAEELSRLYIGKCRLTVGAVSRLLKSSDTLREAEERFRAAEEQNRQLFGASYAGEATDWKALEEGIAYAGSIREAFGEDALPDALIRAAEEGLRENISALFKDLEEADIESLLAECVRLFGAQAGTMSLTQLITSLCRLGAAANGLSCLTGEIAPCVPDGRPDVDRLIADLTLINGIRQTLGEEKDAEEAMKADFGARYSGLDTDWGEIAKAMEKLEACLKTGGSVVTAESFARYASDPGMAEAAREKLARLTELIRLTDEPLQAFSKAFRDTDLAQEDISAVAARYEDATGNFAALNQYLAYTEAREKCEKLGLTDFADRALLPGDIAGAFEKRFYTAWIAHRMDKLQHVCSFKKELFESRIEEFSRLDEDQHLLAQRRLRRELIRRMPKAGDMAVKGPEMATLMHEMEKKMRHMPLRKLFRSIPRLLPSLKPCLMMSPLSVAHFLSADLYQFDTVIFDEASQVFTQDAIGAIFRGKQVIIAGDTKQMPPTNFFGAGVGGSTDYDSEEEWDEADEPGASILEESGTRLPNCMLEWHYRSRHEHLIAFSNREMYDGHLVTFPGCGGKKPDEGVEFVYVPDGYYESSPRNYNKVEAERIVGLIREHIDRHPDRSLGVIAFSEKQQQAISAAVQRFREKQPGSRYEEFFSEDKEEEFFVKNLENVQGDERDTILFSIGYARTKEQIARNKPMALRFGPLGLPGGERRLNVAITRAKRNVKLVSSILPGDIDITRTKNEGVKMLRRYIEFAMNGEMALPGGSGWQDTDEFAESIAEFIRKNGYEVARNVGLSDYRVDIAVKGPVEGSFVAGIECDGESYFSARTTRDRDRLRRGVLKGMGWNMYRVWSTAWFSDPASEGEQLLDFIRAHMPACPRPAEGTETARIPAPAVQESNEAQEIRVGMTVVNRQGKEGRITSVVANYIIVDLGTGEDKKFRIPDAFEAGFLSLKDR